MDDKSRSIASLLHKTQLDDNTALFTFINTVIGYYDDDYGIFVDDQGREYYNIESEDAIYSPNQYACGNIMSLDQAYNDYSDKKSGDIQKLFDAYDEEEGNYFYLCGLSEDDTILVLKYDYNEAIDSFHKQLFGKDGLFKDNMSVEEINKKLDEYKNKNSSINNQDNKNKKITSEQSLENELADNIRKNLYTKEQLKEIKKSLVSKKRNIKNLLDMTQKRISDENYQAEKTHKLPNLPKEDRIKRSFITADGFVDIQGLYNEVTKTLIAQDRPARRLIVEIARLDLDDNKNYGILLTGSTGVGKTELMSLISKNLDRPFLNVDTTQLTSPGYVGKDIEQCLWELYLQCNKDIKKTQRAIVFFDEIDKKGSARKDDVSGKGVLNLLLKFLDGTKYYAAESNRGMATTGVTVDTSDMIIIAGGAFTDVYKNPTKCIGFNNGVKKEVYQPTIDDFVQKAMMPDEFMGRFPVVIKMNDLSEENLKEILYRSRKSPIKLQKDKFKKCGVDLIFTEKAVNEIAKEASAKQTGARGLTGIVADATSDAFDKASCNRGKYESIIITDKTIGNNNDYLCKTKVRRLHK